MVDAFTVWVDDDNPQLTITSPAPNELIGGGVSQYVFGGASADATSWIETVEALDGDLSSSETTSPWAISMPLPGDGTHMEFPLPHRCRRSHRDRFCHVHRRQYATDQFDQSERRPGDQRHRQSTGQHSTQRHRIRQSLRSDTHPGQPRRQRAWSTIWNDPGYPLSANWSDQWQLTGGESIQGEHVVRIRSYDRAGNISTELERNFVIDVLSPTDELTNRTFLNDPPHFTGRYDHTQRRRQ